MDSFYFDLQTLSKNIHMGGTTKNILNEKSLIGAIRWWTEAIIRGAGGFACDPTLPIEQHLQCNEQHRCLACEIFGCQGWAKKFALTIRECNEPYEFRYARANQNNTFRIQFNFFHPLLDEQLKYLLLKATKILFDFGSIGGKIGTKPPIPGSTNENREWHDDYGLVDISRISEPIPSIQKPLFDLSEEFLAEFKQFKENKVKMQKDRNGTNDTWPDFNYFFFNNNTTISPALISYDKLNENIYALQPIGNKWKYKTAMIWQEWLRGNEYGENENNKTRSKKLFVFRNGHFWGWARDEYMLTNDIIPNLAAALRINKNDIKIGGNLLIKLGVK